MGDKLHVKIQTQPDKPGLFTLTPFGPIDSDSYLDFNDQVKPLLVSTTKGILLDLANVDYISSAGLGVLFTMKKYLKQQNGDLWFTNLKPQIKRLFDIVNALPKETMFKNNDEADEYLYKMMNKPSDEDGGGKKKG